MIVTAGGFKVHWAVAAATRCVADHTEVVRELNGPRSLTREAHLTREGSAPPSSSVLPR